VEDFVRRCLDDEEKKFVHAEAWLRQQQVPQPEHDQMWEILSGLVWNIDRVRARQLALEIENPRKQQSILQHYDELEKAARK